MAEEMKVVFFDGNYSHAIDAKGRVTIPSEYRDALTDGFTIGLNSKLNAMVVYPKAKWNERLQSLMQIPEMDEDATDYVRLIIGNSFSNNTLDSAGRMMLPVTLRQMLSLESDKNIRFVGMVDHFEVWSETSYLKDLAETKLKANSLARYVKGAYYNKDNNKEAKSEN